MIDFILTHMLTLLIFVPFFIGAFILITPLGEFVRKAITLITLLFIMALGLYLFFDYTGLDDFKYKEYYPLIKAYGVDYRVGIDGLNLFIVLIVALSFPAIFVLLSNKSKGYWANMLLLQSALMGVVLAEDLIMFYIFWEAMLLPIFIMIGLYGEEGKVKASIKLLLYTMVGSLFMLLAIIFLGYEYYYQFDSWSFSIANLSNLHLGADKATWLFLGFMFAFLIKIPLFPFHGWLSDGYAKAPIGATFALSAVASKVAVYAIIKFLIPLFALEFVLYSNYFIVGGIFSMLFFAIIALTQSDLKRMLAYSSASHLGLVIAGIFALNFESLNGAVFQIVAHALGTGLLFLMIAIMQKELNTRDIKDLRGIASVAPIYAIYFLIGIFAIVGLPSTSGFIGEFLIIVGLVKEKILFGVFATLTIILSAIYLFKMYRRVFFETTNELTKNFKDLSLKQIFALFPFILTIFLLGFYPKFIQDRTEATINNYLSYVDKEKERIKNGK